MQLFLGKDMRKIEARLRRSQLTRIISLSLSVGMMGATIIPTLAQGQIVRASNRHNAMHLAQRPVPTSGELTKLINSLNHKDLKVRLSSIAKLGSFGPGAKAAVPILISLLQDTDAEVRWNSASALGEIGPGAKAAVPQLLPLLRDNNASVRQIAAYALGKNGFGAKVAVPQLLSLLHDKDKSVRLDAILALLNLESVETVPQLIPLLQDPDQEIRVATVRSLDEFFTRVGEASPSLIMSAVSALILAMSDQDENVRHSAIFALGSIGQHSPAAESAVPALISVMSDQDENMRSYAADALGSIGQHSPAAKSAVPALISAMSDQDENVRRSAMFALRKIDFITFRQALITSLQQKDKEIQRTVIDGVKFLTDDVALINGLQSNDENIRQRAIKTLLTTPLVRQSSSIRATYQFFLEALKRVFRK
jgi:HEAT repeat protein